MEISIRTLLEDLEDSSVLMEEPDVVSAMRIKELTLMKIKQKETHPGHAVKKRIITFILAAVLILALGVTAYAINTHWSRGLEHMLPATDEEKQMAEETGLSDSSQNVFATADGVTISVEQSVIDNNTAWIALRIDGLKIAREQEWDATLWNMGLTFDGERPPSWGASFAAEHDENGNLIISAPDGSIEYDIRASAGDKLDTLSGKEIHITIESIGTGGLKSDYKPLAVGPWELIWTPRSNSEQISVQPDTMIGETGVRLISADISPITAKVIFKLSAFWEDSWDEDNLNLFEWQLTGVRLKDGTVLLNIFGPPSSWGYADREELILEQEYSSQRIIQPDQVDALVFANNFPWARTLTDDDLIIVPIY